MKIPIRYINHARLTIRGAGFSRWVSTRELDAMLRGECFNRVA